MPASKDLSKYPPEFFEIARAAFRNGEHVVRLELGEKGKKASYTLQQKWSIWAKLVVETYPKNDPMVHICRSLSTQRREDAYGWYLRVYRVGNDELTNYLRQSLGAARPPAEPEALPQMPPMPQQPVQQPDMSDEELARQRLIEMGMLPPDEQGVQPQKQESADDVIQKLYNWGGKKAGK